MFFRFVLKRKVTSSSSCNTVLAKLENRDGMNDNNAIQEDPQKKKVSQKNNPKTARNPPLCRRPY